MILALLLTATAALPTDFGPCPPELVPFLQYTVQRRAAEGLNRVIHTAGDPKYGTVYGGRPEDANIAWVAAAAYRYDWSRFHHDPALRDEALFLLDNLARSRANGRWDDGGLDAYFGLHSFAWAVLSWLDNGVVDAARQQVWSNAVAAAADDAMAVLSTSFTAGDYANPEFYYLSGLAAAWKITGRQAYLDEAARALHRYDDRLWPGGGVPYFHESSPEHGYQQMVVKSVALYYDVTEDPDALAWLRTMCGYFPRVVHPSGLVTDAEVPHLKHSIYSPINPATPAMLAMLCADGRNRAVADVAAVKRADNVNETLPAFLEQNPNWYNFHHTTYAAAALRLMERHALPEPVAGPSRWAGLEPDFRGVRSHWDNFTAAVGTRAMNDSLAGCYLADPAVPMLPLAAGVQGVFAEVLAGNRGPDANAGDRVRAQYRTVEVSPAVQLNAVDGFASVSCLTRLCAPYWNDFPWIPGERWRLNEVSDWTSLQHWAVWRDHLVGLIALRSHADGGNPATDDVAQLRFAFVPQSVELRCDSLSPTVWRGGVGALSLRVVTLAEQGGFLFGDSAEAPPATKYGLVLARSAPWRTGDFVYAAIDLSPADSDGSVAFMALNEGGAAVMLEPSQRVAWVWVANLARHWRHHRLSLPEGATATVYRRHAPMPPTAAGQPLTIAVQAAESAVVRIESPRPLASDELLQRLESSWGRGEARPARE